MVHYWWASQGINFGNAMTGWLVALKPIQISLSLHHSHAAGPIRNGPGRPIDDAGRPQQKFLSALSEEDGRALLTELGVYVPALGRLYGLPDELGGGESDEVSLSTVRREQADLRKHLLTGRPAALCSLCGEERPARLMVAGHIKPRGSCTEAERNDFCSVAMLIRTWV